LSDEPIRIYFDHDMWHVDYGDGRTQSWGSKEQALAAAKHASEESRSIQIDDPTGDAHAPTTDGAGNGNE
jgi:hypothetical protein